jgi:aarF domain-containing kinase
MDGWNAGKLDANSPSRAEQLRLTIEELGPAYVKIAQALSTRVDILNVHYLRQIEMLQVRINLSICISSATHLM